MNIDGVELIDKKISNDKRGESWKIFESKDIKNFSNNEIFLSLSYKYVIRGMHFQPFPYGQKKIITVLEGCIEGVVLDLRNESDTYLKIEHIDFDADTPFSLLIPEYCAWGYHAKKDKTLVLYNISGQYHSNYDMGIRWDSFGYEWKTKTPILSERDSNLITLDRYIRR